MMKSPIDAKAVGRFDMSRVGRVAVAAGAAAAVVVQFGLAWGAAQNDDLSRFESFSFSVIFPALLLAMILASGSARSREGVLMRFGTACQLILIIAMPSFGLLLLLGLPVVFLLVELFETRAPIRLRSRISGFLVA